MDIVERLRDMKMGNVVTVACDLDDLCQEAAGEIERLRTALKAVDGLWSQDAKIGFAREMSFGSPVGAVWALVRSAINEQITKETTNG